VQVHLRADLSLNSQVPLVLRKVNLPWLEANFRAAL
jgi:hypothetical protein